MIKIPLTLITLLLVFSVHAKDRYFPSISVLNELQIENMDLDKVRIAEYNLAKKRGVSIVKLLKTRIRYINDRNAICYYRNLSSIDVVCVNVKLKKRIEKLKSM